MTSSCVGCVCAAPPAASPTGRLLLATQVGHTAAALRTLARQHGFALRALTPGMLALDDGPVNDFLRLAKSALTSVESEEVRCVVLVGQDLPDTAALSQALTAPTLAAAGARVKHADLVPLFADEANCFHAVYQPIIDLHDGQTIGYESLLRGTTPAGTPVMPDVLFPAAEDAGWVHLIDRIGRTTALRDAADWLPPDKKLFINFIPTSIYRPDVCLRTTELAAREAGIDLGQVVFEVTEGHRIRDLDHLESVFDYYRSHNCKVALDDLGAGYSSLNMLVRLRPDIVKLDKDIVQALPDPVSSSVVAAIVSITHSYGGLVLAECVETEEQAVAAKSLGVDLGQGWLFGRPERHGVPVRRSIPAPADTLPPVTDPSRPDRAVAVHEPGQLRLTSTGPQGMSGLLVRAVDSSVSGVVVVDVQTPEHPMLYVNAAFEAITGYSSADVLGHNCRLLQGPETDAEAVRALSVAITRGEEHQCVLLNYRKDGTPWWNELNLSPVRDQANRVTHYLGYQHDVTVRVEAAERLARQATQDSLTGLSNRSHLIEQLGAALEDAAGQQKSVAVIYLDLDGFKDVNDTRGHAAGDSVLVQVADRLRDKLRTSDLIGRNGGDEFVAVLRGLEPLDAGRIAARAAADITETLQRPFTVPGPAVASLSGSVGIGLFPQDATTPDRLLAVADASMYEIKRSRLTL